VVKGNELTLVVGRILDAEASLGQAAGGETFKLLVSPILVILNDFLHFSNHPVHLVHSLLLIFYFLIVFFKPLLQFGKFG